MEENFNTENFKTLKSTYDEPVQESEFYSEVDKGTRLANFIIDRIAFSIIGYIVLSGIGGSFLETAANNRFIDFIFTAFIAVIYYTLFEGLTGGRTLGKFITGTRAITRDGDLMDIGKALGRSFCRIVPFEPFSFLGTNGWHDSWSDTMVVKEKEFKS
jgi:uncharacterized RDD family membrane protein YckC